MDTSCFEPGSRWTAVATLLEAGPIIHGAKNFLNPGERSEPMLVMLVVLRKAQAEDEGGVTL